MKKNGSTRRDFIKRSALAGTGIWIAGSFGCNLFSPRPEPRYRSPNEKLNVACIGAGGRGHSNVQSVGEDRKSVV